MSDQTAIQKVSDYMHSELIKQRFAEVIGNHNAGSYIASVLIEVASREDLQRCTMQSIYTSALRAATLRLSVDSNLGQAYLVPFKSTATLIVGYKGLVDLATRTGRYRYINVTHIYEGEDVREERISGFHSITGFKTSSKVVGWLAAFEMLNGYGKTLYMTVEEIHEHAAKYSHNYGFENSTWKKDPAAMERKTALRLLLRRWGYLDPTDVSLLAEIERNGYVDDAVYDAPAEPALDKPKQTEQEILEEFDFDPEPQPTVTPAANGNTTTPPITHIGGRLADDLILEKICENILGANALIKKLSLDRFDRITALRMGRGYRRWRDMGADSNRAAKEIAQGNYPK